MKKAILVFLIFLSHLITSKAQTGVFVPELADFDTAMLDLMNQYGVPGGQLAITYQGRLVYSRGFGYADVATQNLVQPYSIFRLASVSKPVTGIAIMKLFEDGLIDLDAKVFGETGILNDTTYQDILDPQVLNITVRYLLQHRGGWNRDLSGDPMFDAFNIAVAMDTTPPADAVTVIKYVLANKLLDFAPGTEYQYSNFGYCVLGRVIEKITNGTYEEYVIEHVLIPSGIIQMQMGYNLPGSQAYNEVNYYDYPGAPLAFSIYDNATLLPWPYGGFNLEAMDAPGRWVASAEDLCRLLVAVDRFPTKPDILLPSTIDTMIAPSSQNPNYALGFAVNVFNNWWHNGSLPGTTTEIVRSGNSQLNWAILLNTRTQNVNDINIAIDNLVWNVLPSITTWPSLDLFTGIEEPEAPVFFSVYPNPSIADFKVMSNHRMDEIVVYDVMGNAVYRQYPGEANTEISTIDFVNGIYFVRVYAGEKTAITKLMVQH